MNAQERTDRAEAIVEVYEYVLNQLERVEDKYLTCTMELCEIEVLGEFVPARSRKEIEAEQRIHEAAMDAYRNVRIQMENLIFKK